MRRETAPWLLVAATALCAGVALRVFDLREQVALDDELVSISAALQHPYALLFGSFDAAYYSIPHALLLKLFADSIGLDELTLRLPSLAAGVALLCLAPWIAWRRFGAAPAGLFAALLAISPLLVLYSRLARAYAIAIALVFFAVMSLERWLAERRPHQAIDYILLSTAAIWFHQLAAPAVLAPLAPVALFRGRDAPRGQRVRESLEPIGLGLAVGLLVTLLLWSALFVSLGPLVRKLDRISIGVLTQIGALALFAGSRSLWLVALFWLGVAVGIVLALRRHARIATLLLTSALSQWLCVLALGPWLAEVPRVFARYVAFALPFALLCLALALAELGRLRVAGRAWPLPLAAGAFLVAALTATGPLPVAYSMPDNFTAHPEYLDPAAPTSVPAVPGFYQRLRDEPGDFAIVEAPLRNSPDLFPYHVYQRLHRKRVRIGFVGSLLDPPDADEFPLDPDRAAFRTFVDVASPEALRASGARYLVMHRDLGQELGLPGLRFDLQPAIDAYARRFGPPVYEDPLLAVFLLPPPDGPPPGSATSAAPRASESGPSQSPQTTASVGFRVATGTLATSARRSCTSARATISPVGRIAAEIPVLVARSWESRVSRLRNADTARCRRGPPPSANHESFESVSSSSAPSRAASRASRGVVAS